MKHKVKVTVLDTKFCLLKKISCILTLLLAVMLAGCRATKPVQDSGPRQNLIIYYEPAAGNGQLLKAAEAFGSEVLYVYRNINGIAVTVPPGRPLKEAMNYYENFPGVLSVTEDRKLQLN